MGQKRGNRMTCAVAAVDSVSSALPLFFDPTSPPVFRKASAAACLLALSRRQACLHTPSLPPPLGRHGLLQSEHSLRRVSKQQQHGSEISESIGIARPRRAPQLRGLGPEEIDAGLRPGDEH